MEKFITGKIDGEKFSAFVTSNKPNCNNNKEHEWNGEELFTFHNDPRTLKKSEFEALPEKERNELSIAGGEVSCSICGIGYMSYDNPLYS